MTAVAFRAANVWGSGWWPTTNQGSDLAYRSSHTSTWSRVKEPPPSAPASTDEADSPRATFDTWLQPVMNRLNHLAQLQDGWGGPGTLGVDEGVVWSAFETLALVATEKTRAPSISPGQDGSLQVAWYAREFELEIDIPRSGNPTVSLYEHDSGEESELALTSPQLHAAIERLAAD
jgi:hypothetical protein